MGELFIFLATLETLMNNNKLLNKANLGELVTDILGNVYKMEMEETGVFLNPIESTFQALQHNQGILEG